MAVSGERRPLDGSLPHKLTSKTPFPSLELYLLIGILSLSALSIALLIYLCIRLSRTLKKREDLAKETNSRASSGPSYEVFLSFRGADNRHEFTDFLYHGMNAAGILVFRDSESLHVGKRIGDELLRAIENSKIYIPIFSKNYASSHWCLRELGHMVECTSKSNGNKEILPIFLDVEPDDVKLKTKLYSKAFSKHQKKFRTEVESWKKALFDVDEIKGWNWKKDESQADLVKSVIETVLDKLNVGNKMIVTENLVGVHDRVEALIKMLDVGSERVQFLIIHGMGGIGKTTLAKCIFNQLSPDFRDHNFLLDIRESSQRHGMVYLQKQLLSKFLNSRSFLEPINEVDEGINMIKRVLLNRKVLIVLDDVDAKEQLKSLADNGDWFGLGSRIIITTRDQSFLRIEGEVSSEGPIEKTAKVLTYDVREMEFDDALKLFSRHAFRRDFPPDHYVSLSNEVVTTLGMLPLALEVTGSSLNNEPKESWEASLNKLKSAPPDEVQSKLKISYDKLNDEQKQIFLDIACFFVNMDQTNPFYMWDACGNHPHVAIKALFLKSLIKIKDDNTFWMHDQLRDLGRYIVRQEGFDYPCERSRVQNPDETWSILKGKKGSSKIKALSLGNHGGILTDDEFVNLQNLRFFQGDEVSLVGDFNNLFSSLTWLSCRDCSFELKAKNFHPTKLVVLDLSCSYISEESIDWIRAVGKLKVLDLSNCISLTRTPYLSTLVCLERLRLRECYLIKKLPDSIGKLQSLVELDLTRTNIDHLPDSIGNLKNLTILRMIRAQRITKLPSAIWLLEKLEVLDASGCSNLTGEIPEEIERLSHLRILALSWTRISRLSTTVNCLSKLQELKLASSNIIRLPELPPSLTCLIWLAPSYIKLESFIPLPTSLGTISQLKTLTLSSPNVRFLPQLPSSLRELQLQDLEITPLLDFSNLSNLSTLEFCDCSMPEFSGIFVPELEKLIMEGCKFTRLDALFQLEMKRLTSLILNGCEFLPEVLDLSHMKNLQHVLLSDCELLAEIRGLEELRKLKVLEVSSCPKLRSLEGLNHLESLKKLIICRIFQCGQLPDRCGPSEDFPSWTW